jgi:hypothetical protein
MTETRLRIADWLEYWPDARALRSIFAARQIEGNGE